jgi:glutamine synthetase
MNPKEVLDFAAKHGTVMVDLKFMDFPGIWQHFSVPRSELNEASFEDGFGFDGSSIRGWQASNVSDMLVVPDPRTAAMDPFTQHPTLSLICNVIDPATHEPYTRDPRYVAKKADDYMRLTGIADTAYIGPEAEFFVFDEVRFDQGPNRAAYIVDSVEGRWNSGREEKPNLGYKPRAREGYFPVAPTDSLQDLRTEMCIELERVGIPVEAQHHEAASGGQCEIDIRFAPLLKMGDNLMWFKYIVKNVARRHQRTATFMPKPIFGDNGSSMHTHQSLWKSGVPLFAGNGYAGLSDIALYYIGGILHHAPALCAFTNPTTNSYKRLVPGNDAPVNLAYSSRNRSASIRIPMVSASPKAKRVEVRFPDSSCNGYLAFAAMLMAGLDGIERKLHPGEPLDKDIYGLPPLELASVRRTPGGLSEALDALEKDHAFLRKGDVFTADVIDMWLKYKREQEVAPLRMYPTAMEFAMYYDI